MAKKKGIFLPARLETCKECRVCGRILFSDGSTSVVVGSQEEALTELEKALAANLILSPEVPELCRQIKKFLLPFKVLQELAAVFSEVVKDLESSGECKPPPSHLTTRRRTLPICNN